MILCFYIYIIIVLVSKAQQLLQGLQATGNEDQQLSAAIEMCQVQSTILYRQYINQQVNMKPCYVKIVNHDGQRLHKYQ